MSFILSLWVLAWPSGVGLEAPDVLMPKVSAIRESVEYGDGSPATLRAARTSSICCCSHTRISHTCRHKTPSALTPTHHLVFFHISKPECRPSPCGALEAGQRRCVGRRNTHYNLASVGSRHSLHTSLAPSCRQSVWESCVSMIVSFLFSCEREIWLNVTKMTTKKAHYNDSS
ncbi:hypothetical protein E2C01_006190 [Portunus trituberculatus]|uniref:Secreted protein n=1 Tax=Portunus trituberculatus TaxID=210409 RepID=A0A5B7CYM3_PORTR|nr:hypothetical protein [Portunus trituberculatus]